MYYLLHTLRLRRLIAVLLTAALASSIGLAVVRNDPAQHLTQHITPTAAAPAAGVTP
jgi:hypothetical protein